MKVSAISLCLRWSFPALLAGALSLPYLAAQQADKAAAASDVLVLSNGDTLHGKLVSEVAGKITFHTESLGDVNLAWDKVKELHTGQPFAVLDKTVKQRSRKRRVAIPTGKVDIANGVVQLEAAPARTPIPIKNAEYIVDAPTLDKQLNQVPNFFTGWNGSATAGATLVKATQNQYTVSGSVGLIRIVPTVSWLNSRNRTAANFSGSYGKITQPAYTAGGVFTPASVTKTSIYHIDGERDEYFSARFFALVQTAYDHNFAQNLQLQQIYGAGIGWTLFSTPRHEADLKATLQYEKQQFITGSPGANQDLVGSTFAANYMLKTRLINYTQSLEYIPSYNNVRAYSANETDTLAFPAYKNLSFSVGTIDTYLNDPPASAPPTMRNSFQFTMGLTYAIKSRY